MSGASESAATSVGRPATTARDCAPEAPYDWVNVTPVPAGVFWKAGMSSAYASLGVEYATKDTLPPAAAPASAAPPQPASARAAVRRPTRRPVVAVQVVRAPGQARPGPGALVVLEHGDSRRLGGHGGARHPLPRRGCRGGSSGRAGGSAASAPGTDGAGRPHQIHMTPGHQKGTAEVPVRSAHRSLRRPRHGGPRPAARSALARTALVRTWSSPGAPHRGGGLPASEPGLGAGTHDLGSGR